MCYSTMSAKMSQDEKNNLDSQINNIRIMKGELLTLKEKIWILEQKIKTEEKNLQIHCPHTQFRQEDNGDFHSPGYYYTCNVCGYFSRFKPH